MPNIIKQFDFKLFIIIVIYYNLILLKNLLFLIIKCCLVLTVRERIFIILNIYILSLSSSTVVKINVSAWVGYLFYRLVSTFFFFLNNNNIIDIV